MATNKKAVRAKSTTQPKSIPKSGRDPKGGLTAAGRAFFAARDGSKLKAGVTGAADTPEKMKRKGSFLVRTFTHPRGPMKDEHGEPTRLALSAHAWGEKVPATEAAAHKLAQKGHGLLEQYHRHMGDAPPARKASAAKKAVPAKKTAATKKASPAKKSAKRR